MPVTIDLERCDGNGECVKACAFAAIEVHDGKAVAYDNCTDCGACVIACAPKAIWSDLFSAPAASALLAVDFSPASAIAAVVERAARASERPATWMTLDAVDAGAAADAIAAHVSAGRWSLLVLPHAGAGPAIAARVAARVGANLLAGCSAIRIEDDGAVRAERPRFSGLVKVASRAPSGTTIVTVLPRNIARVAATPLDTTAPAMKTLAGSPPGAPLSRARRIVGIGQGLSGEAEAAARECARLLGASVWRPQDGVGKPVSPDLYVAFGIEGSTEHNAAFRQSRVVVAAVTREDAPIAQISDYLLVGDVAEHARALLSSL